MTEHTYTVDLRKSIKGVILAGWREPHKITNRDTKHVPWPLAAWLQLMPAEGSWLTFKNTLYGFTPKELDGLKSDSYQRVTRQRCGLTVKVTVALDDTGQPQRRFCCDAHEAGHTGPDCGWIGGLDQPSTPRMANDD